PAVILMRHDLTQGNINRQAVAGIEQPDKAILDAIRPRGDWNISTWPNGVGLLACNCNQMVDLGIVQPALGGPQRQHVIQQDQRTGNLVGGRRVSNAQYASP